MTTYETGKMLDHLVDTGAASYSEAYAILGVEMPADDFSTEAILRRLGLRDNATPTEEITPVFCGDCLNPSCKGCGF